MDKVKARKGIVDWMSYFVEQKHIENSMMRRELGYKEYSSFRAGVFEKRIFNKILDDNIENIVSEFRPNFENLKSVAYNLLHNYYYPEYGFCDNIEFRKAKNC